MPKAQEPRPAPSAEREDGFAVFDAAKDDARELYLLVDENRLRGFLKIVLKGDNSAITPEEVTAFLTKSNVRLSDSAAANVNKAVQSANKNKGVTGPLMVAQGRGAVNGSDGAIDWLVARPDADKAAASGARVDYRDRKPIVNVQQGQKILRLTQPTAGQPGEDIFGSAIGCQPGKAVSARKGKNVETTPDGNEFFAQLPGMLEVVGEAVSIEPLLVIQGDVDMSIGNINFIGPVKVAKDVRDDFKIRAGKEVEIGGMVECAEIVSGSWIRVQGGVAGKGRGRIVCKAGLEARYLSEVIVEAGGDIVVNNSITTASVKSLGRITVNTGGIRGSSVVAQKGLKSPEIGSDMGVRTTVVVGVDYHLKDKLVNTERELQAIREAVEKIEQALGPLVTNGEVIASLAPEKAEIARRLMAQLDMLVKHGSEVAVRRDELVSKMQVDSSFFVEVAKKIYPGVVMQIGTCRRTFELQVTGPVKLYPDLENASIKVSR